jgi:hypothetical protein
LTNARTAGIGKNDTTSALEGIDKTVTSDSSTDLLGSRGDSELAPEVEAVVSSLFDDRGGAGHILIGRVGARTNEADLDFLGPVILLDLLSKLREGSSQIRGERAVNMRLKFGKVLKIPLDQFQK